MSRSGHGGGCMRETQNKDIFMSIFYFIFCTEIFVVLRLFINIGAFNVTLFFYLQLKEYLVLVYVIHVFHVYKDSKARYISKEET